MNIPISNGTPQVLKYGTYTPKYFYPVDNSFFRFDEYKNHETGEINGDSVLTAGRDDLSPIQCGGYDSTCYCCFAGYAHTESKHKISINHGKN